MTLRARASSADRRVAGGLTLAIVLIVCAGTRNAAAQDTVPGPPAAQDPLAGTPVAPPPVKPPAVVKRLDFSLGLYEGYDMTLATDTRPGLAYDPRFRQDTSFSSASGALIFGRQSRNVSVGLYGAANLRYFTVVPDLVPVDYSAGFNVSARWTRHTRVRASTTASYSPYYSFTNLFVPVAAAAPPVFGTDQNVARLKTITSITSAGLVWSPTPKTTVDGGYTLDIVDTSSGAYQTLTQGGNVAMSHRMTRYSSVRLGYGYRQLELGFAGQNRVQVHDIQTGLGYQRPLSFSRHTVVGFNVGASVISQAQVYGFYVIGDASLSHQLSRRWATGLVYHRDVSTFAGSSQPFLSDAVSGTLSGVLARKVTTTFSGGYARGRTAISIDNGYAATNASARLQYQVSRYVPIYTEYVYYHYRFEQSIGLAPGFPLLTNRHGLRFGMSYSVPLVGRRVTP